MRKMFWLTTLVLIFASCKKDSDKQEDSPVIAKWTLVKSDEIQYKNGTRVSSRSFNYDPGDYIEFQGGNKCIIRVSGEVFLASWELLDGGKKIYITGNNNLDVPDDGYEVSSVSSTAMTLTAREVMGTITDETVLHLKK